MSTSEEQARSPGEYIREELRQREWTQADLATILKRPLPTVNRILQGKHGILPDMAIALGEAFFTGPEVWMEREAAYRLSLARGSNDDVGKRARLFELAPVNELSKRGWIRSSKKISEIQSDLQSLLEIESLDQEPIVSVSMRQSNSLAPVLSASQRAWCFRVRQLARTVPVSKPFVDSNLEGCRAALRKLAAYPKEARKVSTVLSDFGIRFVVVEHLAGTKIDGAALWLDESQPVIGMSLRYDRVDGFWHTLFHELSHVKHRDSISVDSQLASQDEPLLEVKPEFERRADTEAAASLIDPVEFQSFISRVGPLYSKDSIVQFAHSIKLHPGVIVGQLQNRSEVGYRSHRQFLAKIRDTVTEESLTDGWGHKIEARL